MTSFNVLGIVAEYVTGGIVRASLVALWLVPLAWIVERAWPALPAVLRSWLWRGVYLRLLVALVLPTAVALPLLPAKQTAAPTAVQHAISTTQVVVADVATPIAMADRGINLQAAAGWIMLALWLAGAIWFTYCLLGERQRAARLRHLARPIVDPAIKQTYQQLARQFGMQNAPALKQIAGGGSPLLVDGLAPAVLLPQEFLTGASSEQVRMALAHELAHYVRRDLGWNHLAAVIGSLLFFHPLLWLAARRSGVAQELACDELAVTRGRLRLAEYADLILEISTARAHRPAVHLVGVAGAQGSLRERLLAMKTIGGSNVRRTWPGPLLAIAGVLALVPWSLAQQASDNQGGGVKAEATARGGRVEASAEVRVGGGAGDAAPADSPSAADNKPASSTSRGKSQRMTTTMDETDDGWKRTIKASDDSQTVEITETSDGSIEMTVTEHVPGDDAVTKYSVKNAAELKTKHPEAFKMYDKFTRRAMGRSADSAASVGDDSDQSKRGNSARARAGGFGGSGFGGGGFGNGGFGGGGGGFGQGGFGGGQGGGSADQDGFKGFGGSGFGGFGGNKGFGGGGGGFGGSGFGGGSARGRASGGAAGGGGGGISGASGEAKELMREQLEELRNKAGDNEQLQATIDRLLEQIGIGK